MKVSELSGAQLDYWTAKAEGLTVRMGTLGELAIITRSSGAPLPRFYHESYAPSSRWSEGGPLIDKHRITFATMGTGPRDENGREPVVAITYGGRHALTGPTHLIAAMRAIVHDTFGEEVREENG
jgi:hypothetical protein